VSQAACAFGHNARGRHTDDCDRDDCRGCTPASTSGDTLYCRHHLNRIHDTITRTPELIGHVRGCIEPGASVLDSAPPVGKREPPAPLDVVAVSDADDLAAALAELAELVMDGRNLDGPSWVGVDVRPAVKRRTAWGAVTYEPARVVGVKTPQAAGRVASWLIPHEGWLAGEETATGAIEALLALYGRVSRSWPMEEQPQHLPTPCPACDRLTLTRNAPRWVAGAVTITCTHYDCGRAIPEEQYGLYTRIVLQERRGA
jgi:hypothetical protein